MNVLRSFQITSNLLWSAMSKRPLQVSGDDLADPPMLSRPVPWPWGVTVPTLSKLDSVTPLKVDEQGVCVDVTEPQGAKGQKERKTAAHMHVHLL